MAAANPLQERIDLLTRIGLALSSESDHDRVLEAILDGAMDITRADGGTVYRMSEDGRALRFAMVRTRSLHLAYGGPGRLPPPFPPVPLMREDGTPNHDSIVAHCVLTGATVNIGDAYHADGFDFTGTRAFDQRTGYRSVSFLTVPLRDHEGVIIGVVQLINAHDAAGAICAFVDADQRLIEGLAGQGAAALTRRKLIDGMRDLFEGLVRLIATAIDGKSAHTGGHCRRVPELTMLLAEAAARAPVGDLGAFTLGEADRYELRIAAWLHDCGKLTTPDWVMEKATKLTALSDRIELVALRGELAKREAELAAVEARLPAAALAAARAEAAPAIAAIDDDVAFLRRVNQGGERMADADRERVAAIAAHTIGVVGARVPFLTADEVENLRILRGTLNDRERAVINHHIDATIQMLESLPYPRHLRRVPEFAGGHHEHMDGSGHPRGLTRAQMSVPARIMGLADVFEALTAQDRPYKKPMPLSQALSILAGMVRSGKVDRDLFAVFVRERVYLEYARKFLKPEQIDAVDEAALLGG